MMAAFLIVFASIHCPLVHTYCAYNFVPCTLTIYLAPAFAVSRTRQTFEAYDKLVLSEDIPILLLANPMPKLEDGFLIKH